MQPFRFGAYYFCVGIQFGNIDQGYVTGPEKDRKKVKYQVNIN